MLTFFYSKHDNLKLACFVVLSQNHQYFLNNECILQQMKELKNNIETLVGQTGFSLGYRSKEFKYCFDPTITQLPLDLLKS